MNCLADQDVTNFRHNTPPQLEPTTTPLLFPSNKAFMKINNRHITNNLEHNLRDNLPSCNIRNYLQKKTSLGKEQMDQIDWDTHGKALQRQPTMLQI